MFSTWKTRLQSYINDGGSERDDDVAREDGAEDERVTHLRRTLADLRQSYKPVPADDQPPAAANEEPRAEQLHAEQIQAEPQPVAAQTPQPQTEEPAPPLSPSAEVQAAAEASAPPAVEPERAIPAAASVVSEPEADDSIAEQQKFVSEQRTTAEALLQGISTLEERFKSQAKAVQASRAYAAAQQKVEAAASAERQAKAAAQNASERHDEIVAARTQAVELLAAVRTEAQASTAEVTELERRLEDARQRSSRLVFALNQNETRAQECSTNESAAAGEVEAAAERFAACRQTLADAEREAQIAKEQAESLRAEALAATQGLAELSDVHNLAMRIAEAASALANGSEQRQRSVPA
jgi:hypothetical protein